MDTHFKKIIEMLGEDTNREGLRDTPKRAADALKFITQGYRRDS
jgi:GTP cyclohydrolase I